MRTIGAYDGHGKARRVQRPHCGFRAGRFSLARALSANTVAIAVLLSVAAAMPPPAAAQGVWASKAPMPGGPRENTGVIALDGKMYVVGGNAHSDTQITRTEVYDPATDTWSARAPMPSGSHHIAAAVLSGKIYTFGGFIGQAHAAPVDNAFEYDPATDRWRALPKLTSPRGSPSAVVLHGKIHVIGGRGTDNKTIGTHDVFDPATGQWSMLAPLAKPRDHLGTVVINGKIHVIGGRPVSFASNETLHEIYDPATNTWTAAAPMPTARSSVAAVEYRGMIVVVGGEGEQTGPGSAIRANEGYDLKTGRWVTLTPMPLGKHGIGGVVFGASVYIPGGSSTRGGAGVGAELMTFTLP